MLTGFHSEPHQSVEMVRTESVNFSTPISRLTNVFNYESRF